MKIRRIVAFILACSMAVGQIVCAEELQDNSIVLEENIDLPEDVADITDGTEDFSDGSDMGDGDEENIEASEESAPDSEEQDQKEPDDMIQKQYEQINAYTNIEELPLYVNYDRIIEVNTAPDGYMGEFTENDYQIQIDNPAICEAEIIKKEGSNLSVKFHLLQAGDTSVKISGTKAENQSFSVSYTVHVKELPADAVPFKDIVLRSWVTKSSLSYDENRDGYLSIAELESIKQLYLGRMGITDLSGLEYAVSLGSIDLNGNTELSDITPLLQLEKLKDCDISNTGVADEERWKLVDFKDFEMNEGDKIRLPIKYHIVDNASSHDFLVEIVENENFVKLNDNGGWYDFYYLTALKPGKVKLKVSYKTFTSEITVTINDINEAQEVGEAYTESVDYIYSDYSDYDNTYDHRFVLKSNGELWKIYPEVKKVKSNVKKYSGVKIFGGGDGRGVIYVQYLLDDNNTLWKGDEKLASDVEKFDGHYALDFQGTLKDLYNKDTEPLHDVESWAVCTRGYVYVPSSLWVYVLKKDGTLWGREETSAEEKSKPFTKIADGIAAVYEAGYLCTDGRFYDYSDLEQPVATNVEEPLGDCYYGLGDYYGTDGYFYISEYSKYLRVGEIDAQDYRGGIDSSGSLYYLILSKTGDLFKYTESKGAVQIDSNVKEFIRYDRSDYRKNDGSRYTFDKEKIEPTEENSYVIEGYESSTGSRFELVDVGKENNNVVMRNNVAILDHVIELWDDFVLRSDGTIWDITDVPKLVLDLTTDTYVMGDVNEDGVVNIEDLRIVLRSVCGKVELSER